MRQQPIAKASYRPEIDGLRAFAVIAVIINHFNPKLLPSGYLGVDIFFVISGFVITLSLSSHRNESLQDFFLGFYSRRVKRLVPALLVFVLLISLALCLFHPEPGVSLGVGRRALFGFSNIYFYQAAVDYFSQETELNPFTHTWSLSVEEQFYLLFPFLVWFSGFGRLDRRGSRNLFIITLALSIISLTSFIILYNKDPMAAYYLMPPRIWELGVGSLLFVGIQRSNGFSRKLISNDFSNKISHIGPLVLGIVLITVLFIPKDQGLQATVLVVALTTGLIGLLSKKSLGYSLLTHKKVVWIGLISYSLYLWHWGVLCISRWTIGVHWWSVPLQLTLMFILAALSYRFIEKPTRLATFSLGPLITISIGVTTLLVASALTWVTAAQASLYLGDKERAKYAVHYENAIGTSINRDNCNWYMDKGPQWSDALRDCTISRKGHDFESDTGRVFILGDSSVGHFTGWISDMAQKGSKSVRALYVSAQISPPLTRPLQGTSQMDFVRQGIILNHVLSVLRRNDVIVLSNSLPGYLVDKNSFSCGSSETTCTEKWMNDLESLAGRIEKVGAYLVVVAPIPEFQPQGDGRSWNVIKETCTKQWFRPTIDKECFMSRSREEFLRHIRPIHDGLAKLDRRHANVFVFDPLPLLCPEGNETCSNYHRDERVYLDSNHLNYHGAQVFASGFSGFLADNRLATPSS